MSFEFNEGGKLFKEFLPGLSMFPYKYRRELDRAKTIIWINYSVPFNPFLLSTTIPSLPETLSVGESAVNPQE